MWRAGCFHILLVRALSKSFLVCFLSNCVAEIMPWHPFVDLWHMWAVYTLPLCYGRRREFQNSECFVSLRLQHVLAERRNTSWWMGSTWYHTITWYCVLASSIRCRSRSVWLSVPVQQTVTLSILSNHSLDFLIQYRRMSSLWMTLMKLLSFSTGLRTIFCRQKVRACYSSYSWAGFRFSQ